MLEFHTRQTMLTIILLGQFSVAVNGVFMSLPSRPAQSLFAYLCLHRGTALRREKVAGIFWPDTTEKISRGYLRHTLWRIRKALNACGLDGSAILQEDRLHVRFALDSTWCVDVWDFLQPASPTLSTDQLMAQLSSYAEFLPGSNYVWDEWTDEWRAKVEQAYVFKGLTLLNRLSQAKRWDELLYWSGRLLAVDYDLATTQATWSIVRDALQEFVGLWKLQIPKRIGSEGPLHTLPLRWVHNGYLDPVAML